MTGTRRHVYGVADPSSLAVPPSWATLGAFSNAVIPMDMPAEAVTGRFPVDDAQNPPSTGLSSDGTVLFTRLAADGQGSRVDAYALPAMKRLWTQTTAGSSYLTILGSGGNTLVAEKTADDGSVTTVGLNAHTGATLWTLPQVDVCGLSTTQMLASANGQTAVIDLASGQQLSYSAPSTAASSNTAGQCPEMLPGGIGIDTPANRLVVTQTLTP